jgi:uncharacterized protein YjbI with pentapeptide repeats
VAQIDRQQTNFMGNREHLNILHDSLDKDTIRIWNDWRSNNPSEIPDLRGVKLKGANLTGYNFNAADLRDADFTDAKLNTCDLNGVALNVLSLRSMPEAPKATGPMGTPQGSMLPSEAA